MRRYPPHEALCATAGECRSGPSASSTALVQCVWAWTAREAPQPGTALIGAAYGCRPLVPPLRIPDLRYGGTQVRRRSRRLTTAMGPMAHPRLDLPRRRPSSFFLFGPWELSGPGSYGAPPREPWSPAWPHRKPPRDAWPVRHVESRAPLWGALSLFFVGSMPRSNVFRI